MTINEFIKQKRLEANLTQQQCADYLDLDHRSSFHRLETGKLQWKLKYLQKFSELLEMKPSQLLAEWENS